MHKMGFLLVAAACACHPEGLVEVGQTPCCPTYEICDSDAGHLAVTAGKATATSQWLTVFEHSGMPGCLAGNVGVSEDLLTQACEESDAVEGVTYAYFSDSGATIYCYVEGLAVAIDVANQKCRQPKESDSCDVSVSSCFCS